MNTEYKLHQCNQLMENWNLCFSANRSVLQGYPEALERQAADLEKEVKEAEKNEDSDQVEYVLNMTWKGSLKM